jgi:glucose-1-phosphate cytidylyltransferase
MSDLTAVLLCGGKGERLRPFTESFPKPLVPLGGRPLLHHLMRYLAAGGVTRFVVCVGYKAGAVEGFLREQSEGWDYVCVNSGDASMTDRILDAREHVRGRALVCYGDTLANVNLARLEQEHAENRALATLTVHPLQSPFGIVEFDGAGRITAFAEKPVLPHWINIGFLLCEPAALDLLRRGSDMPAYLAALQRTGAFHVHRHEGSHVTVNTEKERAQAETRLVDFYTILEDQYS